MFNPLIHKKDEKKTEELEPLYIELYDPRLYQEKKDKNKEEESRVVVIELW